jgi:hypothetical protein
LKILEPLGEFSGFFKEISMNDSGVLSGGQGDSAEITHLAERE